MGGLGDCLGCGGDGCGDGGVRVDCCSIVSHSPASLLQLLLYGPFLFQSGHGSEIVLILGLPFLIVAILNCAHEQLAMSLVLLADFEVIFVKFQTIGHGYHCCSRR